jgi:hypothetical protein
VSITRFRVYFAVASVWCVLAGSAVAAADDQAAEVVAVKQVFSAYKTALLEGNGSAAADVVNGGTIQYYSDILEHVLHTPRAKLGELDLISKFMVLRIRHELTKPEIEKLTGRELFVLGVNKGWISKATVAEIELIEIKVREKDASGSIAVAPQLPVFHFRKESGVWKLNLLASFELGNRAIKAQIAESGLTEEQFILQALEAISPRRVDQRILDGPR